MDGYFSTFDRLLDGWSLEMTAKDVPALKIASDLIPAGSQISVTFLPHETFDARVAAAAAVRRLGFTPIPHISARRIRSEDELALFLQKLAAEAAVDSVFVVAGDPDQTEGPYEDSLAVIRSGLLQANGISRVGLAGHPEGHFQIEEMQLWVSLTQKVEALRELGLEGEITTQFGFDADPVIAWLARLRRHGVDTPVRLGLPGPANVATLLRFAARCGVGASTKVLAKYGVSMTRLIGSAGSDRLVEALREKLSPAEHGDVRLHLYPFGGLMRTAEWANAYCASVRSQSPRAPIALSN